MFIVREDLSVPNMDHNRIPPFLMIEDGINVSTTPKFQVEDPSVDNNSVQFSKCNLRVPLKFHVVFSYFPSTKPSIEILNESNRALSLTPDSA